MRTFARISISLAAVAGLAGVAAAGDPAPKPAPPAPTAHKAAPPPKAEKPKPPAELTAFLKAATGTWRCTGTAMDATGKEAPAKGTIKFKADLDGWYAMSTFAEAKKGGYKYTAYTTFDPKATKWSRSMFDNGGGRETAESAGLKDQKIIWEGTAVGAMGSVKTRHTEDMTVARQVKMLGEMSQDGKTWMKAYDVTCKK